MSRYKVIACEVLFRELCHCASQASAVVDISFLPQGLHDMGGQKMREKLQQELDRVDVRKYDAILLVYALCNNGIIGLHAGLPLVVPKAHDCITLLLGSREKYSDYFNNNAGTFFKSPGWIERETNARDNADSITNQWGLNASHEENLEKYDEETAAYLDEMLRGWTKNYKKMTFIDTHVGDAAQYEAITRRQAKDDGLAFERLEGDTRLLQNLLDGNWDSDYLVLPCGSTIAATNDGEIIAAAQ